MKKDVSMNQSGRNEQRPVSQRNSFLSPWSSEWEPTSWFDKFYDRSLSPFSSQAWDSQLLSPAIDIDETDNEYIVCADMPGIKADDISIDCSGNMLTISAERKYESGGKRSDRQERFYGTYQRSFSLPQGVDSEHIEANYENGVLDIHVPKAEPVKRRKIEIGKGKSQGQSVNAQSAQKKGPEKH